MPPRKKPRLSSRAASTPSADNVPDPLQVMLKPGSPLKNEQTSPDAEADPWTDEQEISLFKGMIRWKPVGPFLKSGALEERVS